MNENVSIVLCGGVVADIIVAGLPQVADPGKGVQAPEGIQLRVGGHSANISRDLVKLGASPKNIYLAVAVGNDIFGQFIERSLSEFRINLRLQKYEMDTTKNVILVVKGEDKRSHISHGASLRLNPNLIIELLDEVKPSLFYAGALSGKIVEDIYIVLKKAKELGCITLLDTSLPPGEKSNMALNYSDILHLNNLEAIRLTNTEDLASANKKIMQQGVKISFITSGDKGALVRTKSFELQQPAFKVDVIDPTGAGDAFCSGILYSLMERMEVGEAVNLTALSPNDLKETVLFGQAVGAVCCTGVGTTEPVNREDVLRLIKDQGEKIRKATKIRSI